MMNAKHVIAAALVLVGVGSIVDCSGAGGEASPENPEKFGPSDSGRGGVDSATLSGDATPTPMNNTFPGAPDGSRGIIVVHGSANLPAFRLCFGTLSQSGYINGSTTSALHPLPDRDLMPDSNVVGVEIGSAVRLSPLGELGVQAGDHVFAIPEVYVRPGSGTDLPCSARICPVGSTSTCLQKDPPAPGRGYYDLGPLPTGAVPAGDKVQLLVLDGCVPGFTTDGGAGAASCGAGYDPAVGNTRLDLRQLNAYKTTAAKQFFVQVAQLSERVVGTALRVKYGELAAPMTEEDLGVNANFGEIAPPNTPKVFTLDPATPGIYASHGFQISVGTQVFKKSLAEIQLVTAPQAVPEALYSAQSNFVLLLLGDPALSDAQGNAISSMTEPGLLLHLLVVPVSQPVIDGGIIGDAGGG